jgi:hypothetical protein
MPLNVAAAPQSKQLMTTGDASIWLARRRDSTGAVAVLRFTAVDRREYAVGLTPFELASQALRHVSTSLGSIHRPPILLTVKRRLVSGVALTEQVPLALHHRAPAAPHARSAS